MNDHDPTFQRYTVSVSPHFPNSQVEAPPPNLGSPPYSWIAEHMLVNLLRNSWSIFIFHHPQRPYRPSESRELQEAAQLKRELKKSIGSKWKSHGIIDSALGSLAIIILGKESWPSLVIHKVKWREWSMASEWAHKWTMKDIVATCICTNHDIYKVTKCWLVLH